MLQPTPVQRPPSGSRPARHDPRIPEIPDLARAGVRRVSLGPWPMLAAMRVIEEAAAAVAASKQYGTFLQPNA